jgi:hypothetical protein
MEYSSDSFYAGPDGSVQQTERLVNGKGTSSVITNHNGIIQKKTQKIDLNSLLKKTKKKRIEGRLISMFMSGSEKKKWKKFFKRRSLSR